MLHLGFVVFVLRLRARPPRRLGAANGVAKHHHPVLMLCQRERIIELHNN